MTWSLPLEIDAPPIPQIDHQEEGYPLGLDIDPWNFNAPSLYSPLGKHDLRSEKIHEED